MSDSGGTPADTGSGAGGLAQGDTEITTSEIDVLSEGDGGEEETPALEEATISDDEDEGEGETTEEEGEEGDLEEEETEEVTPTEGDEEEDLEASEDLEAEDIDEDLEVDDTNITWQMLKEKYPEAVKDKGLRELFHSHQAYREIYPTVQAARDANEGFEAFNILANNLNDGKTGDVIKVMRDETLEKFSETILPALYKHNPKYFKMASGPLIMDVLNNVKESAEKSGDKNLTISVRNLSRFLTGSPEVPPRNKPVTTHPEIQKERDALRRERADLFNRDNQQFITSADVGIESRLTKIVNENLDPDRELTQFTRNAVVEKTLSEIKKTLIADEPLAKRIYAIREQAARAGFTKAYQSRIISTYLERAKKLVLQVRAKHKNAALDRQPSKGTNENEKVVVNRAKKVVSKGGKKVTTKRHIDMRKTSAEDLLNDRVTYK